MTLNAATDPLAGRWLSVHLITVRPRARGMHMICA